MKRQFQHQIVFKISSTFSMLIFQRLTIIVSLFYTYENYSVSSLESYRFAMIENFTDGIGCSNWNSIEENDILRNRYVKRNPLSRPS